MKECLIPNKVERIMNKNKPKKKSSLVKIIMLCLPILGITGIIGGVEYYLSTPVYYQTANLNGDERQDLIIKNRRGEVFELVQGENGKYRLLAPGEKEAMKEQAMMDFYFENKVPFSSSDFNF